MNFIYRVYAMVLHNTIITTYYKRKDKTMTGLSEANIRGRGWCSCSKFFLSVLLDFLIWI